jgi:hypothetical protein
MQLIENIDVHASDMSPESMTRLSQPQAFSHGTLVRGERRLVDGAASSRAA